MTDDPSRASLTDAVPAAGRGLPPAAPWSGREGLRAGHAVTLDSVAALRLAMRGRFISLAVVAVLLFTVAPAPDVFWFHGLLLVFGLLGWLQYRLHRLGGHRLLDTGLMAADFTLLTFTLLFPNPLSASAVGAPIQLWLNGSNVIYFFIILGSLVFSATPRRVMIGGVLAAAAWSAGFLMIALRPDSVTILNTDVPMRIGVYDDAARAIITDPHWVDIMMLPQQVVVIVLVAWILSIAVGRSRRLLVRQAEAARQRANLARYFPPTVADRLARRDDGLGAVSVQPVAVLFADVVGFTALSERQPPEQVVAMLRELHRRLADAIFAHDGTLDKFLGDGVMATFGTPETRDGDAARALDCGRAMLREVDDWNRQRTAEGVDAVRLSVGLH
ncbi:MAG: adenylate/guanylate cyclase domain-containing protein, partial [Alphaproteobacteria bacterium]